MPLAPKIETPTHFNPTSTTGSRIRRFFEVVNVPLIIVLILLTAYGLLIVHSATLNTSLFSFNRQVMGVGIGVVLLILLWRLDYRRMGDLLLPLLILDFILILSPLLPFIGVEENGANRWVNLFGQQIQPSELAKLVTIIAMASLVGRYRGKIDSGREYLKCLGTLLALFVAIMLQPDLGTGLVFFAVGIAILFVGGAHWKWLLITLVALSAAAALVLYIDPILDDMMGRDVLLKEYQKNRLLVFMDDTIDPMGIGYNLKQAKIAIGSGGLMGKGLYNATQSTLGFLPEAPTDFIFCVVAEELGFVGCMGLLALFAGLILSSLWVAFRANNPFGNLLVIGCVGMWIFQILENIGMTCGLMPITGIPLPFVSFGSSAMVTNFMAVGIILSVWTHREKQKGK